MQTSEEKLSLLVVGPSLSDEYNADGHMAIHYVYESFEPHPKLPFFNNLPQSYSRAGGINKWSLKPQYTQTQPVTPTVYNNLPHTVSQCTNQKSKKHHLGSYLCFCKSSGWQNVAVFCILSSSSLALTFMLSVFVSDRVGRSTVAHVEEETAAEAVNVSQRRVPG